MDAATASVVVSGVTALGYFLRGLRIDVSYRPPATGPRLVAVDNGLAEN
jgi:hypothetical protein